MTSYTSAKAECDVTSGVPRIILRIPNALRTWPALTYQFWASSNFKNPICTTVPGLYQVVFRNARGLLPHTTDHCFSQTESQKGIVYQSVLRLWPRHISDFSLCTHLLLQTPNSTHRPGESMESTNTLTYHNLLHDTLLALLRISWLVTVCALPCTHYLVLYLHGVVYVMTTMANRICLVYLLSH